MVAALEPLGVEARLPPDGGSLPLTLRRRGEPGGRTTLDASRSSQFLSGLLMVAPRLPAGLELALAGPVVSRPYVELTRRAMAAFGAAVHEHPGGFVVPPAPCRPAAFAVEGDWSGGAFLLAAGFIAGRPVQVANLDPASPQGDRAIAGQLAELRRPRPHRFDLTHTPDLIAPLAAACVFAGAPSVIAGAGHARLKESDRVAVLAAGLRRAGVAVDERPDGLRLEPPPRLRPARLDPRGDHRMAMAFGLLSLRQPALEVADPQCVAKSYPGFWQDLERFR
jgi:3-phosphoshikimate 1-carboxyvinyltransferase